MSKQSSGTTKELKGVRRRKWGKWVSEIRVPGTQERLWLGTYSTAEAAAVAHDVAVYCLKRPSTMEKLNFPETMISYVVKHRDTVMSPRSVQKLASDAGMDVDARNIAGKAESSYEVQEKSGRDDHVIRHVHNEGDGGGNDEFWWEDLGYDSGSWDGSEGCSKEGEALSISVDDYL